MTKPIDTALDRLVDVVRGITFPTSAKKRSPGQGLIACLRTTNVQDTVEWEDLLYVDEKYARTDAQKVQSGDILVSMSNSLDLVGKCAFVGAVPQRTTFGAFVAVVRARSGMDPRYVFHAMRSPRFRQHVRSVASTTTNISNINNSKLLATSIPVFGAKTRKLLVSKIDELLSRVEEGELALERAQKLVEHYRQSVLNAAVTGQLTHAWREKRANPLESGESLLKRILKARREAWEKAEIARITKRGKKPADKSWKLKYLEPESPETNGLSELPAGWVWASPVQLHSAEPNALTIGPFGSNLKVSDYRADGVPLIFVRNIRSRSFGDSRSKYVSPEKAVELSSHLARAGDVLITKMGAPPGDACVYPAGSPDAVITADCIKWTLHRLLPSVDYFSLFINSSIGRSQFAGITKGVAQQKVSLDRFRQIAIALPGPEEQREIAERVEVELKRIDVIQQAIEAEALRAKAMRRSILDAAFSGQLVTPLLDDVSDVAQLGHVPSIHVKTISAAPQRGRKKKGA